jgi:two-component system, NarL family, sensor histidine kinase DegS
VNETSTTLDSSTFLQLQEEERQRLAHALMHGPCQVLANVLTEIEYSIPLLKEKPDALLAGLNALCAELRTGLIQLQDYVAELQPPLLVEMGLGPSAAHYVKKFGERTGIRAECHSCEQFTERFPATIETALFRILQEALTNVETHAQATRVRVQLTRSPLTFLIFPLMFIVLLGPTVVFFMTGGFNIH